MTDYKALWQQMCERCDELDKRLTQLEYKSTSDHQLMENAQGELERIKLVQTGIGIEQRAEEAYEAAKQRSWIGVSDEVAQPEQEPVAWLDPWTRNTVTTDYDAYGKHGIPLYTKEQL